MPNPTTESYSEALARFVDERASGLLTAVGTGGVALLLRNGRTAMIGPHDGIRPDDDDAVARATAVEALVAQLVTDVTSSAEGWQFLDGDDGAGHALIAVPAGLPGELARRTPAPVAHTEVAAPADSPAPVTAVPVATPPVTPAAVPTKPEPVAEAAEVAAAEVADVEDARSVAPTPVRSNAPITGGRTMAEMAMPVGLEVDDDFPDDVFGDAANDGGDEPAPWVMDGEVDDGPAAAAEPRATPATSTLTEDDVANDDWADTSWLDELSPKPGLQPAEPTQDPPGFVDAPAAVEAPAAPAPRQTSTSDDRARAAAEFAGLLGGDSTPEPAPEAAPAPVAEPKPASTQPKPGSAPRSRPRGDDVSEFLRELSRLALEDES